MPQNPPPITPEAARAVLELMRRVGAQTEVDRTPSGDPDVGPYARRCWATLVGALSYYAEEEVTGLQPAQMARAAVRRAS